MAVPGESLHSDLEGGWILPEPAPRTAIHTRSIVCRSFRRDDGGLDLDGRFIDTRAFAYDSEWRGLCPPGSALHQMQLRLSLDRERRIQALVSAMPATPYTGCAGVNPNFQRLVGLSIGRGFRKAMRERLDGAEGCTHVIALLDALAAAAVQAMASNAHATRTAGLPQAPRALKLEALIDSCHGFRADGPVVQRMLADQAAAQAAGGPA